MTAPAAIRRRLEEIRDAGFAWTAEELHDGLTSVAAPVRGPSGAVVAALHCHGPSFRFPVPGTEDDVGATVRDVAERFSARMAGVAGVPGPKATHRPILALSQFRSRTLPSSAAIPLTRTIGARRPVSHDAVSSRIVDNGDARAARFGGRRRPAPTHRDEPERPQGDPP